MLTQNIPIFVLVIFESILLIVTYYTKRRLYFFLAITLLVVLGFLQINTTNIRHDYSFSAAEIDRQIQRMNYYPPSLARLGYILEKKHEVQIINILQANFFEVINVVDYFANYINISLLPLFLLGLYTFFNKPQKNLAALFFISVVTLTILGVHGKNGPFLLFPFIYLFVFVGINSIFNFIRRI